LAARASAPTPADAGPGFHLGCVTWLLLKDFDVPTIIRTLEDAGYEAVELRTSHKHGVEPSIGPQERTRVRRLFEQSKVRLLSYGTTCRFESPDAAQRKAQVEIAKQFVDLAHDTGALGIKIQPMGFPADVPQETSVRNFGGSLGAVPASAMWPSQPSRTASTGTCSADRPRPAPSP
jgi:sugar phosphate isomerase/epimerase